VWVISPTVFPAFKRWFRGKPQLGAEPTERLKTGADELNVKSRRGRAEFFALPMMRIAIAPLGVSPYMFCDYSCLALTFASLREIFLQCRPKR
jgi:hypothetical protein